MASGDFNQNSGFCDPGGGGGGSGFKMVEE